jgi:uncharacterized membrane protein
MPNLAAFHPQVVHFVIALGLVGVAFRLLSLLGRGAWLNPAAAALLIFTGGAGWVAARSGTDAHGITERIPGAREAVQIHEDWGNRTRNLLLGLGALELIGLFYASRRAGRVIRVLSAATGVVAAVFIFETGEHGGDLVYNYAGGIGTRSGNPADVGHLLVAGLYHGARVDRDSGRAEGAARLTDEMLRRMPDDPIVKFLAIESKLKDQKNAAGALADLAQMQVPADDPRLATRHGILASQALVALGKTDSARALLTGLAARFPQSAGVKDALAKLP